jgi:hypothetical protein
LFKIVDPHSPLLVSRKIHEGEFGAFRPCKLPGSADCGDIGEGRVVRREDEVIAVVDRHAKGAVVIRATTSPRLGCSFMDRNFYRPGRETHGSGKAGKTGADNMDGTRHQMKARRIMIQSRRVRGTCIGRRGGDQPRCTNRSRIMR